MRKITTLLVFIITQLSIAQTNTALYHIIPQPDSLTAMPGTFALSDSTVIVSDDTALFELRYLKDQLKKQYNLNLRTNNRLPPSGSNFIWIIHVPDDVKVTNEERYQILVEKKNTVIIAKETAGLFYGVQSFLQLLPGGQSKRLLVPCVKISDIPRYQWRGMHLDCCRHFFTREEVKKYIDYMAMYKFNVFHWHLTDDQGWRIEIKKYPLLTAVGGQRKQTLVGKPSKDPKNDKYDGKPYGGFYTQEDIKEIVAYATERHITVVPEIEMPGHALAALAAYPQYSCTGGPFETFTTWGVSDDVYCAGNDSTFTFIETVLSEVMPLFPGKYIHIGGDECPKDRWKACPKCQARMKTENLKDADQLQSYFVSRIEKYVNSQGKQIIGWDEILEGGLAPNAAVMSWRGTEGGIAAAKQKHYVVMSPGKPCYFDHYQSKDKSKEPLAIGGFNPLDSVYNYEPAPKALSESEKQYILGAQGNVWTEYITDFSKVEYMALPRMCALSEVLWTKPQNKNYNDFIARLKVQSKTFDKMHINYAQHFKTNSNQ